MSQTLRYALQSCRRDPAARILQAPQWLLLNPSLQQSKNQRLNMGGQGHNARDELLGRKLGSFFLIGISYA